MSSIAPLLLALTLVALPCAAGEDPYREERRRLLLGQAEAARQVLEREPVNPDGKKYFLEDYSAIDASAPDWSERMAKWVGSIAGYVSSRITHPKSEEEEEIWAQARYDAIDRGESVDKDRMLAGEVPMPPAVAGYYRKHPALFEFWKLDIQYRRRQTEHLLRGAVPEGTVLSAGEFDRQPVEKLFGVTSPPEFYYLVLRPDGLAIQDHYDRKKEKVYPYPAGWKRASRKAADGKPALIEDLLAQVREFPDDEGLRGRLFAAARTSRPDLPDEAIRFEGRAEAAVKAAKSPTDFGKAAAEYRKAVDAAPWVAKYYYNLGLVLEKAGKPGEAVVQFKRYLAAAGRPDDALAVKKRIAGLEYTAESQQEETQAADARRAGDESIASRLRGRWKNPCFQTNQGCIQGGHLIDISNDGTRVRAVSAATANGHPVRWVRCGIPLFDAEIKNGRLVGTWHLVSIGLYPCTTAGTEPMDVGVRVEGGRFYFKWEKSEETWELAN